MSIGQALPFFGSVFSGVPGAMAASYQAQVAKNNAVIAHQNAGYAAEAANVKGEQEGLKARDATGRVRAAIGANNLDVNTGSPADVQTSERELGFLNTSTVTSNEALQVYGYQGQQQNFLSQAQLDSSESENDLIGGVVSASSSLISQSPNLPDAFAWMAG